jgi:hypothetical protein
VGKGILLELHGRKAVVLTSQGEFRHVALAQGAGTIGDEVDYQEIRTNTWLRWTSVAAAACIVSVAVPFGYQSWALEQPVSFVTVDINPSVRLTLNKVDQVIAVAGLNTDGQAVLQGIDWKRRPITDVLNAITSNAVAAHKLDPVDETSAVVIAVAPVSGKTDRLSAEHQERLTIVTKDAVQSQVSREAAKQSKPAKAHVAALEATMKDSDEAATEGLTPGQFMIWREITASQPEVKADAIRTNGPGELLKKLHLDSAKVLQQAEAHDGKSESAGTKNEAEANPVVKPVTKPDANATGAAVSSEGKTPSPSQEDKKDPKKEQQVTKPEEQKPKGDGQQGDVKGKKEDVWEVPILGVKVPKPSYWPRPRTEKQKGQDQK